MENLILTIIVGFIGGFTAFKLKVPAGMMVGSMIAIAAFNITTGRSFMPQDVRILTQMAAGAFIGSGVGRKDVMDIKYMIKSAILMVSSMMLLNILMGYIMSKTTGIDLVTSLFASAPGGIVDMSLISNDMGADTSKVAILQMVRLMIVFTVLPAIMKFIHTKVYANKGQDKVAMDEVAATVETSMDDKGKASKESFVNLLFTLGTAIALGLVGYKIGIPAGTMTFAMVGVGALNIFTGRGYMPLKLRRATQVFAGILIGSRMTYADVIALQSVLVPAIIMLVGIIVVNLCIGFIISKVSKIEITTALLASAPGGLSDMALIARELGGDGPKVAILQLARYVCIVAFYPIVIRYVSMIL
ncbi:AbrB family transcriptional regulator [Alkalicella caledoniensis]|uniref:AbrB family transcriptional regulator n=1 Tax=Alkalicella caledoniensis TaxID=2731377 RepID=A0A7G9W3L4_ALKCA|nr:AbrB family transcriptional regulator [Alkalicella caledoniensis]QNO13276.1 AbrB family transcriptional regulator [Alkalicella caledoniensis]